MRFWRLYVTRENYPAWYSDVIPSILQPRFNTEFAWRCAFVHPATGAASLVVWVWLRRQRVELAPTKSPGRLEDVRL